MITAEDQENLFRLISRYLKKDVTCYAFGGNAMMYYGYKNATKDVDLLFETQEDLDSFIEAITALGYKAMSMHGVYVEQLCKEPKKPVMYTRGDERFDLFLKKVFQTKFRDVMKQRVWARYGYIMKNSTLTVFVLSKEDIVFLKSITKREKDFDDIRTIIERENTLNWNIIVDEAVYQSKQGDGWAVLDLEETMKRLKEITFLKQEYFDKLYEKKKG